MTNTPFNQLTPAEAERLAILIEEASEVIQVAGKILRHGWITVDNSVTPPVSYDNRMDLNKELGHVHNIVDHMMLKGDVSHRLILEADNAKNAKWGPYLHHQ